MLTLLVFLGALSTIHQNSFLPIPSVVRAQSTSSTAVASIVPQNISDFSKVAGSIVTYNVTVAAAPSISSFAVWIQFDPQVLNASNNAISSAGNVLGSDAQVRSECINGEVVLGQACQAYPLSDFGVVSLELFTLGGKTTSVPTSGLLFQLTLRVVKAESFSRVHFLQVVLANGITNENYPPSRLYLLAYTALPRFDGHVQRDGKQSHKRRRENSQVHMVLGGDLQQRLFNAGCP